MLIVGQTFCGETTFIQNLAKNKMFSDIKNVFSLTKITLSREREQNMLSCFYNVPVTILYPQKLNDFNMHFDFFQKNGENNVVNNDEIDEKIIFNKIIVMDDVSVFCPCWQM